MAFDLTPLSRGPGRQGAPVPESQVPQRTGRRSLVGTPTRIPPAGQAFTEALNAIGERLYEQDELEGRENQRLGRLQIQAQMESGLSNARKLALEETDPDNVFAVYRANSVAALEEIQSRTEDQDILDLTDLYAAQIAANAGPVLQTHEIGLRRGKTEAAFGQLLNEQMAQVSEAATLADIQSVLDRWSVATDPDLNSTVREGEDPLPNKDVLTPLRLYQIREAGANDIAMTAIHRLIDGDPDDPSSQSFDAALTLINKAPAGWNLTPEQRAAARTKVTMKRSVNTRSEFEVRAMDEKRSGRWDSLKFRSDIDKAKARGKLVTPDHASLVNLTARLSQEPNSKNSSQLALWVKQFIETDGVQTPSTPTKRKELYTELVRMFMPGIQAEIPQPGPGEDQEEYRRRINLELAQRHRVYDPAYIDRVAQEAVYTQDMEQRTKALEHLLLTSDSMGNLHLWDDLPASTREALTEYRLHRRGMNKGPSDIPASQLSGTVMGSPVIGADPATLNAGLSPSAAAILTAANTDNVPTNATEAAATARVVSLTFEMMSPAQVSENVRWGLRQVGGLPHPWGGDSFATGFGLVTTGQRHYNFGADSLLSSLPTGDPGWGSAAWEKLRNGFSMPLAPALEKAVYQRAKSLAIDASGVGTAKEINRFFPIAWMNIIKEQGVAVDEFNLIQPGETGVISSNPVNRHLKPAAHLYRGTPTYGPWQASMITGFLQEAAIPEMPRVQAEALQSVLDHLNGDAGLLWSHRIQRELYESQPALAAELGVELRGKLFPAEQQEALQETLNWTTELGLTGDEEGMIFGDHLTPQLAQVVFLYAKTRDIAIEKAWGEINQAMTGEGTQDRKRIVVQATTPRVGDHGESIPTWRVVLPSESGVYPQVPTRRGDPFTFDAAYLRRESSASLRHPNVGAVGTEDKDPAAAQLRFDRAKAAYQADYVQRAKDSFSDGTVNKLEQVMELVGRMQGAGSLSEFRETKRTATAALYEVQSEPEVSANDRTAAGLAAIELWAQQSVDRVLDGTQSEVGAEAELDAAVAKVMPDDVPAMLDTMRVERAPGVDVNGLVPPMLVAVAAYANLMGELSSGLEQADGFLSESGVVEAPAILSAVREGQTEPEFQQESTWGESHALGMAVDLRLPGSFGVAGLLSDEYVEQALKMNREMMATLQSVLGDDYRVLQEVSDIQGRRLHPSEWHIHIDWYESRYKEAMPEQEDPS